MAKKTSLFLVTVFASAVGCGGGEETAGLDASLSPPECTEDGSICALVHVPADFSAEPRQLAAAFYEDLPVIGPPQFMAAMIDDPAIGSGSPLPFEVHDCLEEPGEYYLYLVLYVEGGGAWNPEVGVDYVAHSDKLLFGADPVNLHDVSMTLAEED